MAHYVISDIHGEYEQFLHLLEIIQFKEEDTLYVLGDVVDRGKHPIKTLLYMMQRPNIIPLFGNHEHMMVECMSFFKEEITKEAIDQLTDKQKNIYHDWIENGGKTTFLELVQLDQETRDKVIDYVLNFHAYQEINFANHRFLLVHAGLGEYERIEDASLYDLIWVRNDYKKRYDDHTSIISGHTPTLAFSTHPRKGYICFINNHIAIDCGACFEPGRLSCLCLETMEEFYSR